MAAFDCKSSILAARSCTLLLLTPVLGPYPTLEKDGRGLARTT